MWDETNLCLKLVTDIAAIVSLSFYITGLTLWPVPQKHSMSWKDDIKSTRSRWTLPTLAYKEHMVRAVGEHLLNERQTVTKPCRFRAIIGRISQRSHVSCNLKSADRSLFPPHTAQHQVSSKGLSRDRSILREQYCQASDICLQG